MIRRPGVLVREWDDGTGSGEIGLTDFLAAADLRLVPGAEVPVMVIGSNRPVIETKPKRIDDDSQFVTGIPTGRARGRCGLRASRRRTRR